MASTSKVAALKKKLAEVRLQLEMGLAEYVAVNGDQSYRKIGQRFGYPASWICEIAKKCRVNRSPKTATSENT
jgi:hypothetical protein